MTTRSHMGKQGAELWISFNECDTWVVNLLFTSPDAFTRPGQWGCNLSAEPHYCTGRATKEVFVAVLAPEHLFYSTLPLTRGHHPSKALRLVPQITVCS